MKTKVLNFIFLISCFLFLASGLIRATFFPKDVNNYENRYAVQFNPFSVKAFFDSSLQDNCEDTLADQVLMSQTMKKEYNYLNSGFKLSILNPLLSADLNRYISFNSKLFFNGNICFPVRTLEESRPYLDSKINNYNQYFASHPDTEFYIYYIEKDTDIDFETNESMGISDYIFTHVNLPKNHMATFEVNSFSDFQNYFYKTDHHWNYKGSYLAYQQVLSLLGCEENPLIPKDTMTVSHSFAGSKVADMGGLYTEDFTAYQFEFPPMSVRINGNDQAVDYGAADAFFNGERTDATYGNFYGGDDGEIVFDTHNTEKENILLIGESYDNAILKLVASHYNRTYSVDLRYYEAYMGHAFHLEQYIKENNISKVLLIGNVDYFEMQDFLLED